VPPPATALTTPAIRAAPPAARRWVRWNPGMNEDWAAAHQLPENEIEDQAGRDH
jgi:hypothetical protein